MEINPDIVFYKDRAADLKSALRGESVSISADELGISVYNADACGKIVPQRPIFQTIIRKVDKFCKQHELSFQCACHALDNTPLLFIF